jgi:hypothetical protein
MTSVERLRELFVLREDGALVRRVSRGGEAAGTVIVGCPDAYGHLYVRIDRKLHAVHRVVFALSTGSYPIGLVDHVDRCATNNHPSNLRLADKSQNSINSKTRSDNKSGFRGVSLHSASGRWYAELSAGGKRIFRKSFGTARDAIEAYILESLEHHGEFSPFWSRTA